MLAIADVRNAEAEAAALRAGLIAAEIRNSQRRKKSDRVWKPSDFVRSSDRKEPQTVEEMESVMHELLARMGGPQ